MRRRVHADEVLARVRDGPPVEWQAMSDTEPAVLPTDDLYRLLAEVANGVSAAKSVLPDTPLVRKTRATIVKEVADIRAKGGEIDVPTEAQW